MKLIWVVPIRKFGGRKKLMHYRLFILVASFLYFLFTPFSADAGIYNFDYDKSGQLINVTYDDGGREDYIYDATGNRLSLTNSPSGYINDSPSIPSNPVPADGFYGFAPAELSWTGGDSNAGDIVYYDIYLGKTNPPPLYKARHLETVLPLNLPLRTAFLSLQNRPFRPASGGSAREASPAAEFSSNSRP